MSDCCTVSERAQHLVILGGGSAAFSAALRAVELGARATIINDGLPIGGTCVNVGCVPSKTLLRAAHTVWRSTHVPFDGIAAQAEIVDFAALMAQARRLVADLRQKKYLDVVARQDRIRVVQGRGRFVDDRTVLVGSERITADRFIIATGARPWLPDIEGVRDAPVLTSDSVWSLGRLPRSMVVVGGRYVALELAQMFARFGTTVTVLQRSDRILPELTSDLSALLTRCLEDEGIEIVTGVKLRRVRSGRTFEIEAETNGAHRTFEADQLLVATGRMPNTADLGLASAGIEVDGGGFVRVDETLRTTNPAVWAAGDVIGAPQFVYTAAAEGALAAENALTGDAQLRDYSGMPWVLFSDPAVAGVGMDEHQAAAAGHTVDVATLPLDAVPRAIVAYETRGMIRLVRDRDSDLLLGARIVAPEAGELVMEVALAIRHRIPVADLRDALHPYLTMSEGIKLAAITFDKSVDQLSCCAT